MIRLKVAIANVWAILGLWFSCGQAGNETRHVEISETDSDGEETVRIDSTEKFVAYYPKFERIDLVCGVMPEKTVRSVVIMAEAAFTGSLLKEFKHTNIAGDHVSSGVRYKGYKCKRNTGAFVFYQGAWKFLYQDYSDELDSAALYGGMGVAQEMMIHKGVEVEHKRPNGNRNQFRALCEKDGCVCVIETCGVVTFGAFIHDLLDYGVTEALYLDMGPGWNYAWWRDGNGRTHDIHPRIRTSVYCTNWIVFYKKSGQL